MHIKCEENYPLLQTQMISFVYVDVQLRWLLQHTWIFVSMNNFVQESQTFQLF
jgi:hypothetical protein